MILGVSDGPAALCRAHRARPKRFRQVAGARDDKSQGRKIIVKGRRSCRRCHIVSGPLPAFRCQLAASKNLS